MATALDEPYRTRFTAHGHAGLADTRNDGVGGCAGMRPHELLEAALATCMTITARMAMEAIGIADPRAAVIVRLVRASTTTIVSYRLTVDPRLDDTQRAAVTARVERSPVVRTLQLPIALAAGATAAESAIAPPASPWPGTTWPDS
jgi:putative redox protein